jgi:hypothetical protein
MASMDSGMDAPYLEALKGILKFGSFAEAEKTLKQLENLCRIYRAASDKKGEAHCQQIAVQGRRRAELISRNRKVALEKRLQKKEIAMWFGIWIETPELFDDWHFLRKSTPDFQKLLDSEQKSS